MSYQVAKKRFVPNVPVKAGTLYKVVINNKDYIVKAKYDKTLSEFNAMWFNNESPKQYFFNRALFNSFNGILMPYDEIIVDGVRFLNDNSGALSKAELDILFDTYKEARLVSGLLITGQEDHRIHKFKIRPYLNTNAEELKYFSLYNLTRTVTTTVYKINKVQQIVYEVIEAFTPLVAGGSTNHSVVINFTGFTATYQGTSPSSSTATSATYLIPNALTSRKLTITPNGASALILKFE